MSPSSVADAIFPGFSTLFVKLSFFNAQVRVAIASVFDEIPISSDEVKQYVTFDVEPIGPGQVRLFMKWTRYGLEKIQSVLINRRALTDLCFLDLSPQQSAAIIAEGFNVQEALLYYIHPGPLSQWIKKKV
ncbi:M [Southwest carpet python virus]|uniref:M n=1 Tax=Southwest carpet python virus TaxID=2016402 RepID=A0A2K8MNF5_9MONO|nr:M [Southwest carpet python virus] [Southwest carpet python virus]ATY47622.1 M [Southwest carpet python virus] [Southwest carpet python virus]